MSYHTKCTKCYGRGTTLFFSKDGDSAEGLCNRCGGTGKIKPYRKAITLQEGAGIGWNEMESSPRYCDDKCCVACNKPLPKRRSFCSDGCKRGYLWRVWKGAHWQKRAIAHRDGAACKACGEVFESPIRDGGKPYPDYSSLQLDHIKALHLGGDESPSNCQMLCIPCHAAKTKRERVSR